MIANLNLEYITDNKGHKKSVIISYPDWKKFEKKQKKIENKLKFLEGIDKSVDEVIDVLKGNKKAKSLKDLLDELPG